MVLGVLPQCMAPSSLLLSEFDHNVDERLPGGVEHSERAGRASTVNPLPTCNSLLSQASIRDSPVDVGTAQSANEQVEGRGVSYETVVAVCQSP